MHIVLGFFKRIIEKFLFLLYNQLAIFYDVISGIVSRGNWKGWVLSVSPFLSGPMILEIGHGPGHLFFDLVEENPNSVALDRSIQMSKLAKRRLLKRTPCPRLVNGSSSFLPFKSELFHQVVATFPSSYVYDRNTISEIWRVLKPSGDLVLLLSAKLSRGALLSIVIYILYRIAGVNRDPSEVIAPELVLLLNKHFATTFHNIQYRQSTLYMLIATKTEI